MAKYPLFCFTACTKKSREHQNRLWTRHNQGSLQNGAEGSHICLRQSSILRRYRSYYGSWHKNSEGGRCRKWILLWHEETHSCDNAKQNWSSLSSIVPPSCLAPPINNALETGSPTLVWTAIMHDTTHSAFIPLQCNKFSTVCNLAQNSQWLNGI